MIKKIKAKDFILILVACIVFYLLCDFGGSKINYIDDNYLKYRNKNEDFNVTVNLINKHMDNSRLFLFARNAYAIKLLIDEPINKYDLINNGNMGYNGASRYIDEIDDICSDNSCVFIVDNDLYHNKEEDTQMNQDILDYVYNNYNIVDNYESLDVLSN